MSCNLFEKADQEGGINKNSYIVGLDTTLYKSIDDALNSELIEVGTLVEKTGKCRESLIKEGENLCPIIIVYSQKEGWVFEYALVRFEEYLP